MYYIILYYIVLYIETYKRDILTGLMNRRSFYLDAKRMHSKSIAVISIDLNGLKDINDSLGHSVGDISLQQVGNAMFDKGRKNFFPYRIGGDEFMALGKEQTAEAAKAYIKELCSALAAEGLSASFGYALYHPGDNFDDICNQADANMYDDKRRYKHRANLRD